MPGPGAMTGRMLVERVPVVRIRARNEAPPSATGAYVLYWMTAARRTRFNFALDRALEWCRSLNLPLVVLEPLRVNYPYACDRFHAFAIDGMRDNARELEAAGVRYIPYVEPSEGAGRGLLRDLAERAAVVIGDESVTFFLPRMLDAAGALLKVLFETVDGEGLMPLSLVTTPFVRAYDFRRFLQKNLAPHLRAMPLQSPLAGLDQSVSRPVVLDPALEQRYALSAQRHALLQEWGEPASRAAKLASLPIDHAVGTVPDRGGHAEGAARLKAFVDERLSRYGEERSHPDDDAASGLSFWLHWGHVSPHEVLAEVAAATGWTPERIGTKSAGTRDGWWNASESADAFLDELVTWRELGRACAKNAPDFLRYEGLPAWARRSLEAHASDPRPHLYDEAQLEAGQTDDAIWNAAMHELRETGRIQNYLRMLWGKRVLTWTKHPREAFEILVRLNDRWAVDGRDPSGYANIGWVLGAFDRPWAPERPIFGVIRLMTSGSTVRKLHMREYLARWGTGVGELPIKPSKAKKPEQASLDLDE